MGESVLWIFAIWLVGAAFCALMATDRSRLKGWIRSRRRKLSDADEAKTEAPKRGTFFVVAGGDWKGKQKYETREDASDFARRMATRGHDCLVVQLLELHEATYTVKTETFD